MIHIQTVDNLPVRLKTSFDLSFLSAYGRVFKVFDDQDSGNLCFGVERDGLRRFVKLAGAPTLRGCVSQEEAVRNLRATEPIYRDLAHPNLIQLQDICESPSMYAMIFAWEDGECMGRMYPESHSRFMALPVDDKLRVFDSVADFLIHTHQNGYVAIDFYDGSILYDAETQKTTICDIDFFREQPCINDMGRMWGSARFQAPEEYQLGASIDEITNVYTLGATAFSLFIDSDRERNAWPLNEHRYQVATKAISPEREKRYSTLCAMMEDWNQ